MKKIITGLVLAATSTAAFAGSYQPSSVDDITIQVPIEMGGSGSWLIPLVIIAVLALALTTQSSTLPNPNPNPNP